MGAELRSPGPDALIYAKKALVAGKIPHSVERRRERLGAFPFLFGLTTRPEVF
jgi:hypothetical protein